MAELSIPVFGVGDVIRAANLNTIHSEFLAAINKVQPSQLAAGIPADILLDNQAVSWTAMSLLPITSNGSLVAPAGVLVDGTYRQLPTFQPTVRPGWEASLCAIGLHVVEFDTGGTDQVDIRFRRNGAVTLAGQAIRLAADNNIYLAAQNDPIANPLSELADGDYIDCYAAAASGTPEPRGVTAFFAMKHVLVS